MKQIFPAVFLAGALTLTPAGTLHAQDFAGRWAVQPVLGMTIPHNDFGEDLDPGFQWGMKLRRNLHDHYAMDLSWLYTKHNFSDIDADLSLTHLTWDHTLYISSSKIKPWLGFGLGLYRIGSIPVANADDEGENTIGMNIGVGMEFLTSERASLLLNLYRYHIAAKADKLGDIGVRASTFSVGLNIYLN